eukprot:TRINITY_DN680_c0_g1_i2.p1 TRINITY_DN680_c0_g1~~TRINITY_DN680_c0_g1_i2.p1  ORF type:complete len:271 (+),score=62.55 TRINITY_DN680_c0_g1_i2:699-1511(+)
MAPVERVTAQQKRTTDSPFATDSDKFAERAATPGHAPGGSTSISFGDQTQGFAQRHVAPVHQMAPVERVTAQQMHTTDSPFATQDHSAAPRSPPAQMEGRAAYQSPGGSTSISFGDQTQGFAQRHVAPVHQMAPVERVTAQQMHSTDAPFDTHVAGGTRTASRAGGGLQNQNNTIGDVPSVKLYHAPGGSSSISFGDEPSQFTAPVAQPVAAQPAAAQPAVSAQDDVGKAPNRTASRNTGGLQNQNNTIGDVPSVKLHAPPGGASSISFG